MQKEYFNSNVTINKYGIIALFIFICSPWLGFLVACYSLVFKSPRKPIMESIVMGLFFGCCAYWINPKISIDLVRYFEDVESYFGIEFDAFWNFATKSTLLPGKHILFYLVARTKDVHILPFISTTISYTIAYYISFGYAKIINLSNNKRCYLLLSMLTLIPFLNVASNVRNIMAFSLIVLAVYRDIVENKRDIITYLLYFIPLTIHISAIVLIVLRIAISVVNNDKIKTWKRFLIIVCVFVVVAVIFVIINYYPSSFIGKYFIYIFGKTERISSGVARSQSSLRQFGSISRISLRIFYEAIAAFICYVYVKTRKIKKINTYEMFSLFVSLVCICLVGEMQAMYLRFAMSLVTFSFPAIINRYFILHKKKRSITDLFIVAVFGIGVLYNVYRLHLSADLGTIFLNAWMRPLFIMFSNH